MSRGDRLVLCYHAVSATWPERYCVTPEALERHARRLLKRGYRGVTFAEAVAASDDERVFAMTFDDAYMSVRDNALPILDRLGVCATVFAVGGFAEEGSLLDTAHGSWQDTEHASELRSLSWNELSRLADHGWEIGSHTMTHRKLTTLDDAELAAELGESKAACEAGTGRACVSVAYPYGDFDGRVAAAAMAAGYAQGATLWGGERGNSDPLQWPRVGIARHHSPRAFALKTSRSVRRARTGRVGEALVGLAMRARGRGTAARPS